MTPLRLIIGGLIAVAIGIALIPLAVLLDLHEGGTGWGLCQEGLSTCRNSYFAGFEFVAYILGALFAVLAVTQLVVKLLRWLERREARTRGLSSAGMPR